MSFSIRKYAELSSIWALEAVFIGNEIQRYVLSVRDIRNISAFKKYKFLLAVDDVR